MNIGSARALRLIGLLAICTLLIGAFAQSGLQAAAESGASTNAAPQSAPVSQCNDDAASNVGGQGISCTVTIANFVRSTGTIDPTRPTTVTVTRCVGAAGPIGAGAGTCTTTTTTSTELVTSVAQCNGSANGGGGVLICSVTMTNTIVGGATPTAATVYQCVGSVITGTGAPGTCTPANTPGVTSVTAATVGQCNGSGNGGTSVSFICTVGPSSTISATLSVNVDQCNGSANGGGSLVRCSAAVNSLVEAQATATPTPIASVTPTPGATATPSATPIPAPVATATPVAAAPAATPVPAAVPALIPSLPSTSTQDLVGVPTWVLVLLVPALLAPVLMLIGRVARKAIRI